MKIGVFGGSFNPIHIGHAILANYITQFTDIDQLWFMVSPQNPLKGEMNSKMDTNRIRMADMVARRCIDVSVSAFEFTLPRPSFTINTLQALQEKFPNDKFSLIMGADNWCNFSKWKDYNLILSNFGIMVYPRMNFKIIPEQLPDNVEYLENAPIIEVSSTFVREGLRDKRDMSFFLPDEVYAFILRNSLYTH